VEDKLKDLLREGGISTPVGVSVSRGEAVPPAVADFSFPVFAKAVIPVGKKNRLGAVRRINDRDELALTVGALFEAEFAGRRAPRVLVEEGVGAVAELFVSFNFSSLERAPILLISRAGGVDIEESVSGDTGLLRKIVLDLRKDLDSAAAANAWLELGLEKGVAEKAVDFCRRCYGVFRKMDLMMLEINPLMVTETGDLVAVGALADCDDEALWRQPALREFIYYREGRYGLREPSELERRVTSISEADPTGTAMLMEWPGGNLGWLFAGGGCSLYSADICESLGGRPATYFDATTLSGESLAAVIRGVLAIPGLSGLAIGCNIRSMVRVDDEMRAIVSALTEAGMDLSRFPVVVRSAGQGEEAAREMAAGVRGLEHYGADTPIEDAIARFIDRVTGLDAS
jgi:succinyl-CoA synthetase beta subunit